MRLIVISKSIESDLRSYYRVDTEIPMDIFYQLIKDVPVAVDKPIKSTVLDISLGGFLLGCNRDLPVGNQYKADLILKDTIINISFDIVRKASSLKFTNQYGCIFKNNSRKNDQELCKYIFYREKLKRIALNNII
jgi:c-di-GMP-binding flagellar brake protein YcgR